MKKKYIIFLTAFLMERAVVYIFVKKTFDDLAALHRKKTELVARKAWSEGWDAGRVHGRIEGRRNVIDMRNKSNEN